MKTIAFIFSILLMGFSANASPSENETFLGRGYDGNVYIFVESGVEFSVFPDGQFDFVYIGPQKGGQVTISTPDINVSFNSGYNYDAYVQYDDYGAVIQVEDVPIYYDEYGRITQAGSVDVQYNDRRIVRVGGLHVIYNSWGYFSHYTGAINIYNPYYVHRPWHAYYIRPVYAHCVVYDLPYRRYYQPVRYSYHDHLIYYRNRNSITYQNGRRDFYRPGNRIYDKRGRSSINKEYNPDRRNTMVATTNTRSNQTIRNTTSSSNINTRNSSTNSKAVVRSNSRANVRNNNANTRNSITKGTEINTNLTHSGRTNTASNQRAVQPTKTRAVSLTGRNGSETKSKTQAPQRKIVSRSTVKRSNVPSRSSSKANSSRGNSSNSDTSRGRG